MTLDLDPYLDLGKGYAEARRPDPRVAALIHESLGDARTVVNVGAGAGSYEPADRNVIAVEPSATMIAQRPPGSARVIQGVAEDLPFADQEYDAALAVLTVHHWTDPAAGLRELRRVARRQVVLTWDPAVIAETWLVRDYLPEIAVRERTLATLDAVVGELGPAAEVRVVPVPADCTDGFLAAHWRRPEAYLDPVVRRSMSAFANIPESVLLPAMDRLRADLDSGAWSTRNAELLDLEAFDAGYRLVVAQ